MNDAMSAAEMSRVIALLNMLASNYEGERANAGILVTRMIKAKGLTWADLIRPALSYRPGSYAPPAAPTAAWRHDIVHCLEHPSRLTAWEIEFLNSICVLRTLSPKQYGILLRIVAKVCS